MNKNNGSLLYFEEMDKKVIAVLQYPENIKWLFNNKISNNIRQELCPILIKIMLKQSKEDIQEFMDRATIYDKLSIYEMVELFEKKINRKASADELFCSDDDYTDYTPPIHSNEADEEIIVDCYDDETYHNLFDLDTIESKGYAKRREENKRKYYGRDK